MPRTILVAHQGTELYGSDRQLLESVTALVDAGWRVIVVVPQDGPLCAMLEDRGAEVTVLDFPVLRRRDLSAVGLARLSTRAVACLPAAVRLVRREKVRAIYVNTLVIPFWLGVAVTTRRPALCHVHEAFEAGPRSVRALLVSPLLSARSVLVNSAASRAVIAQALPAAAARATVVYNGVPGPREQSGPAPTGDSAVDRLVLIGRLSPNKGSDVALEAVALLRAEGRPVELDLVGAVFSGYEWYETQLRDRAERDDLRGAIHFRGFMADPWGALQAANVALVPSRTEPFGNAAVEAQLASRPVVVARTQGLVEIVEDSITGVVVRPDDPGSLAEGIRRVLDDDAFRQALVEAGRRSATERFSLPTYRRAIAAQAEELLAQPRRPVRANTFV